VWKSPRKLGEIEFHHRQYLAWAIAQNADVKLASFDVFFHQGRQIQLRLDEADTLHQFGVLCYQGGVIDAH